MIDSPDWQVSPQTPPLHTWPAAHVVPTLPPWQVVLAPQNSLLVLGSTQVPLQLMSPGWHVRWQTPAVHTCPEGHAMPALAPLQSVVAPQKARLVFGSMQVPPQLRRPAWQVKPHAPPEQTCPAWHVVPTVAPAQAPLAPQNWLFVVGSMHAPPQLISPAGHEMVQAPLLQT